MMEFKATKLQDSIADSLPVSARGTFVSAYDAMPAKMVRSYVNDVQTFDSNFAFLKSELSKLHEHLYEPAHSVTYGKDINVVIGDGFVDAVTYYSVDWAGIVSEFRNIVGNNANYIPRINAAMTQNTVNVYTFEMAYDIRFIELEKMKKLTLQKSIQEIYQSGIIAAWDLFVQKVAYTGIQGKTGLFNSTNVLTTTIDNNAATKGFAGMTDNDIVSFFNGVFETYLSNSNMNLNMLPDTFLVPTFVGRELSSRASSLYSSTLRKFIVEHNLGTAESDGELKIRISSRPELNDLGSTGKGRIVAYKNTKETVRLDMPYPIQHYTTMPNVDKASYTSFFVGQVSDIQLPYNTTNTELGAITYWDFIK